MNHVHTGTHAVSLELFTIDTSGSLNCILCEQGKKK